ncbi:MAG: glycosyltransferase family 2 protein [Polyangiaceae bacterium]|nr:glycosyltransferase family 2 protein [Polyangiaceae bacterium]
MTSRLTAIVPALDAETTVGPVARALLDVGVFAEVVVVDDGSTDATGPAARAAGATVLRHGRNRGKGAALRTGMIHAYARGARAAVSVDADGQHPAHEAARIARSAAPPDALVLGVRDLRAAGAPRANQWSNAFSDAWVSLFAGRPLADSQCGLRRYPLPATLGLGATGDGFEYESEVVLLAALGAVAIVEEPVAVWYPPPERRRTHFRVARDPARIVERLVSTFLEARLGRRTGAPR